MKILVALAWIVLLPLMVMWEIFKGLLGLANDMERGRKRRSRHSGVMCGPGGSKRRR